MAPPKDPTTQRVQPGTPRLLGPRPTSANRSTPQSTLKVESVEFGPKGPHSTSGCPNMVQGIRCRVYGMTRYTNLRIPQTMVSGIPFALSLFQPHCRILMSLWSAGALWKQGFSGLQDLPSASSGGACKKSRDPAIDEARQGDLGRTLTLFFAFFETSFRPQFAGHFRSVKELCRAAGEGPERAITKASSRLYLPIYLSDHTWAWGLPQTGPRDGLGTWLDQRISCEPLVWALA